MRKIFNFLKAAFPFLITFFLIIVLQFFDSPYVRAYPAIISTFFFLAFFISIFQKETVIQKMAKAMNPDIKQRGLDYARKLTYVWSFIMFIMLIISIITIFLSKRAFDLYHGFISYVIIGLVFAIEHFVRSEEHTSELQSPDHL